MVVNNNTLAFETEQTTRGVIWYPHVTIQYTSRYWAQLMIRYYWQMANI